MYDDISQSQLFFSSNAHSRFAVGIVSKSEIKEGIKADRSPTFCFITGDSYKVQPYIRLNLSNLPGMEKSSTGRAESSYSNRTTKPILDESIRGLFSMIQNQSLTLTNMKTVQNKHVHILQPPSLDVINDILGELSSRLVTVRRSQSHIFN